MMLLVLMLMLVLVLVNMPDGASSGPDVVEGDGICQCKGNNIRISKLCFAI